jgi:hypothetical protein
MRSRSQAIDGQPASRRYQTMETVKIGDGKGRGLVANAAALAQ